jgi:hypothetical protein
MQVEVKKTGCIENKLQLCKFIKDSTGWGLKDSKDWLDSLDSEGAKLIDVSDPIQFELGLMDIRGVSCDSKSKIRQRKLVEIGIGDKDDKIFVISEKLTEDLMKNYGTSYKGIKEFFRDFLTEFGEEKLNELLKSNK